MEKLKSISIFYLVFVVPFLLVSRQAVSFDVPGFNSDTYLEINPDLGTRYIKEQHILDKQALKQYPHNQRRPQWLQQIVRLSITKNEKGRCWLPSLPKNFDWKWFMAQNPTLVDRFIGEQIENGLNPSTDLDKNRKLVTPKWLAKRAHWLQRIAQLSIQGKEGGYHWLQGLPIGFNWKCFLSQNPTLADRFVRERTKQGLNPNTDLDKNRKLITPKWLAKRAHWLQRIAQLNLQGKKGGNDWLWSLPIGFSWKHFSQLHPELRGRFESEYTQNGKSTFPLWLQTLAFHQQKVSHLKRQGVIGRSELYEWCWSLSKRQNRKSFDFKVHTSSLGDTFTAYVPMTQELCIFDMKHSTQKRYFLSKIRKTENVGGILYFPGTSQVFMVIDDELGVKTLWGYNFVRHKRTKFYTTKKPSNTLSFCHFPNQALQRNLRFWEHNLPLLEIDMTSDEAESTSCAIDSTLRFVKTNPASTLPTKSPISFSKGIFSIIFDESLQAKLLFGVTAPDNWHIGIYTLENALKRNCWDTTVSYDSILRGTLHGTSFISTLENLRFDKRVPSSFNFLLQRPMETFLNQEEIGRLKAKIQSVILQPGNPRRLLAYSTYFGRTQWFAKTNSRRGVEIAKLLNQEQQAKGVDLKVMGRNSSEDTLFLKGVNPLGAPKFAFLSLRGPQLRWMNLLHDPLILKHLSPRLPKVESYNLKARDGLEIQTYITRPTHGLSHKPGVLLVHGGPHARDKWQFDPERFLLASRGYTVMQVNFRGSSGFGKKFEQLSKRNWGGTMIDDLQDVVRWASRKGYVNPSFIGAVGSSYGGHAALSCAAFRTGLVKCAIGGMGLYNLAQDYDIWSAHDLDPYVPQDLEKLKRMSPYYSASKVNVPVLLIHGEKDTTCEPNQSKDMYTALRTHKKKAALVLYQHGEHSSQRKYIVADFTLIEHFLARYLKGRHEPLFDDPRERSDITVRDPGNVIFGD